MNKKINILVIVILFFLIIFSLCNHHIIVSSILESANMFINNVFPFLFIMMILNKMLIECNFPYYFNHFFKSPSLYIFIMSLLSGAPTNAIIIQKYLEKGYINETDASFLLAFTNFNNPLFLYHYFLVIFQNHAKIFKAFFIIYIGNFLLFLFFKKKIKIKIKNNYQSPRYIHLLLISIKDAIYNLISIFAIITFFKLLTDLFMPSNNLITSLLKGLIEVTQGLHPLSTINASIIKKGIITIIIIAFSGLSIHLQIGDILKDYQINYMYFYLSKIFLIILSIILFLI